MKGPMEKLKKFKTFSGRKGPLLLVIMDGVGLREELEGNAVAAANKPTLDWLMENCPNNTCLLYTTDAADE